MGSTGVATYTFPDNVTWDRIHIEGKAKILGEKLDAICLSSLAQRYEISRQSIMNFVKEVNLHALQVLT